VYPAELHRGTQVLPQRCHSPRASVGQLNRRRPSPPQSSWGNGSSPDVARSRAALAATSACAMRSRSPRWRPSRLTRSRAATNWVSAAPSSPSCSLTCLLGFGGDPNLSWLTTDQWAGCLAADDCYANASW